MNKKSGKFVWIPAATENDLDGVGLYVTYKKYRLGPISVKRATGRYLWIDCPDRDILVQRERYYAFDPGAVLGLHPESYDEYIHIDVNNSMVMGDLNLEYGMLNALSISGSGHRKNIGDRNKKHTKLIVDSGGFQLYSGVANFIKPEDVIETQNLQGDLGMVLDLPCPQAINLEFAKKLARIQKANTKIMVANKRDDLELINIIHGMEPHLYKPYRDMIERDDIDRVAFGTARREDNPLKGVRKITDLLTMPGRRYKQYHVLGISDIVKTIPIMWLAKMGVAPLITVDSSTHVRNAANGMYLAYSTVRSPLQKLEVSRKYTHPSRLSTLPCGCAVCSRLKYSDTFAFIPGALMSRVLTFHNLLEYRKYMATIFQLVLDAENIDEFLKEVRWSITRDRYEEVRIGIQMAQLGANEGMEAVDKKYHFHLHQANSKTAGLFQNSIMNNSKEAARFAWLNKKVAEYFKYHGLKE
jgi:tRNA-guanine family transglycosylase